MYSTIQYILLLTLTFRTVILDGIHDDAMKIIQDKLQHYY